MRSLCVDLASVFSACMVMDSDRQVLAQWDSRGVSAIGFWKRIRHEADRFEVDILAVEDVPIRSQYQIDRAYRLQGIGMAFCHPYLDRWAAIQPQAWQKAYPGVGYVPKEIKAELPKSQWDKYREEQARLAALNLGYQPPDLVAQYINEQRLEHGEDVRILKKNTNPLVKNMTDYVDAFLISKFVQDQGSFDSLIAFGGVSPALI